jgi:hypothetical protein
MEQVYLCPRCFEAQSSPGNCPNDGEELLGCRPGDPDDPCRRPLMNNQGKIVARAPVWWLQYSVRDLLRNLGTQSKSR